ncbi:MAG: hypothetical protein A4E35_01930 [Methanoregula sp. PtaU1.Bin051]|nr:MAG: hypothetical protein A4E35_01930 [Methanoregula sp. PtaU1.Bin051]
MPNFDGRGPLKRGRVIGRGRGFCSQISPEKTDTPGGQEPGKKRIKKDLSAE